MFLQEPDESPYDLRFEVLGFPVRIAWTFWLGAAVFGWQLADGLNQVFPEQSPGTIPLLLLWALCLLVSVLVHELGHALAFRHYGIESSIVLYHFGGLAIPYAGKTNRGFSNQHGFASSLSLPRMDHRAEFWIALAGPLAQLALGVLVIVVVRLTGYQVTALAWMPLPLESMTWLRGGEMLESFGLLALSIFIILPSVLWAFLNLLPVFPLDGGRIMRSLVLMFGGRGETWLWVSLISAAGIGVYAFRSSQPFMGIMFLSLAMGNYQMLQGHVR